MSRNGIKSSPNLSELINRKQQNIPNLFNSKETSTNNINVNSNVNRNAHDNESSGMTINLLDTIRKLINQEVGILNNQLLLGICQKVSPIFQKEPQLLNLKAPIYVCGDIHGQYEDLLNIFRNIGYPPKSRILFLGDYVDRGKKSLEVISLLFLLKIKYPNHIYLIRGNHECSSVNRIYGFYDECDKRSNLLIWKTFNHVFSLLPVSALIDQKIFCVHGGLSPKLINLKQINQIKKGTKIPDSGILCDLTWADPSNHKESWEQNDRGVSYTFNQSVVDDFLMKNNIDLICRAHQVVDKGYEFSYGHKLVTVFSAPNYCGEYGNSAAVMKVEPDLTCSFIILRPVSYIPPGNKKASLLNHVN